MRKALIRICPICDGYEVSGLQVGVLGDSDLGAREALFLLTWTDRVSLIHVGPKKALSAATRARLAKAGVTLRGQGFDPVYKLGGGMAAWKSANLPLEK